MTLLVIVRPEPGSTATLAKARATGLEAVAFPLFEVQPVPWAPPDPGSFDALLIGSANSLRHAGADLGIYRGKPAYAVGGATAQAAAAAGLAVIAVGSGGLQALLSSLAPGHNRLLRLAGRARVTLIPPPEITMIDQVVYDSSAVPMPADLARLLATRALGGTVILLHSARAAHHFAQGCNQLQVPRDRLRLVVLSPRVAAAAGSGWAHVAVADQPEDAALLALAGQLCQNSPMPSRER